jgi:cytochrome P450
MPQVSSPPGPRGYPLFGVLPHMWRDPLGFFERVAAKHGGLARVGIGRFTLYLVSDPEVIQQVLVDRAANYWKGAGLRAAEPVFGRGLITATGDHWRRQRRLMQPDFANRRILARLPVFLDAVDALLERWALQARTGHPFDVLPDLSVLVQTMIARALFGASLAARDMQVLSRAFHVLNEHINHTAWALIQVPARVPTPRNRRFRLALAEVGRVVRGLIARARQRPAAVGEDGQGDLLGRMVAAVDDSGQGMDDRQLRDEVMTLFMAGHDTTAVSSAWTLHLLSEHPAAQDRLRDEVTDLLGEARPAPDDLSRIPWVEQTLQESMRIYPPAWMIVRTPYEDDELAGYEIPRNSPLLISQWVVHRRPDLWPDPTRFDPGRFERGKPLAHRMAYFPFGGGNRLCIGSSFALVAAQALLVRLVQRFRWETPADAPPVVPQPLTVLRPRHGVHLRLRLK